MDDSPSQLTHLDAQGHAQMVDVGAKPSTERVALARGEVALLGTTIALIREGSMPKGDVAAVARIAGIMAAKRTSELIPLCHPLPLTSVKIEIMLEDPPPAAARGRVIITARAKTTGQTGVEMEALTAVSVAALTVYDMVKAVDRGAALGNIRLLEKSGGKSGTWIADE
jgi:cyclic pyranopterin phosphate synthase